MKALHELGALTVCLGYLLSAAQGKGNELTVNPWSYREPMRSIELSAKNAV